MKAWFLAIAGLFAVVPGLAALLAGLGVPPGQRALFGALAEIGGCLSLGIVLLRAKIPPIPTPADRIRSARRSAALAAASLAVYLLGYFLSVVSTDRGTVYFPLWSSGELADLIQECGSRPAAIERYGRGWMKETIDKSAFFPKAATTLILLSTYVAAVAWISRAFAVLYHPPQKR